MCCCVCGVCFVGGGSELDLFSEGGGGGDSVGVSGGGELWDAKAAKVGYALLFESGLRLTI